jgi:diadenosine tetraphosphate (Ap4A) HIT family hydrolase
VYEDELAVALLQRFQTLYGYVIVVPKEHRDRVSRTSPRTSTRTCSA